MTYCDFYNLFYAKAMMRNPFLKCVAIYKVNSIFYVFCISYIILTIFTVKTLYMHIILLISFIHMHMIHLHQGTLHAGLFSVFSIITITKPNINTSKNSTTRIKIILNPPYIIDSSFLNDASIFIVSCIAMLSLSPWALALLISSSSCVQKEYYLHLLASQ